MAIPVGTDTVSNTNYSELTFEQIKHINEYGQEFWYARELRRISSKDKSDNMA